VVGDGSVKVIVTIFSAVPISWVDGERDGRGRT